MYGYIYKTTNLINNKIYIGQKHSSKFLGNQYLGSGRSLKESIKHYGKENFKVELIEEIETKELMDERKIYWISYYHATNKEIGYNLSEGGNVNRTLVGENNPFYGKHHTEDSKRKNSEHCKGRIPWNKGLTKDDARVKKYSEHLKRTLKERGSHSKNTVWIHKLEESKMIKLGDLDYYLSLGWATGRASIKKDNYKFIALGRIRVNNGIVEKNVKEEELQKFLSTGWIRGRLKFKDTSNYGKHVERSVICIETNIKYNSCKEAAMVVGLHSSTSISKCCKHKEYTAGGYHWQYVKEM